MGLRAADDRFWDLIDNDAELAVVGEGFVFTEGPIWHPVEGHLTFSDIPGNIRRSLRDGVLTEVRNPSDKCNGMTYDADLNLLVCEHVTSTVVRESADGSRETIASHFEDRELNSPNDIIVRSDGSIYFSDPTYGRMDGFGLLRDPVMGFQGVYRIPPDDGDLELVVGRDEYLQPNGLCFSPDESMLYINDTDNAHVKVYDMNADGSLLSGRIFASGLSNPEVGGAPDGMKCDAEGNIWVTGPGGVWVFDPDGIHLGNVDVSEVVANLHWGGSDWHTLYLTSSTSVRAIATKVGPHVEPFMRAG
ncbi:MAG: SMP-30/gluconolactonase/LRE family protein [Acidimicrobiales bacterium]|nr:SMP-30/gluconolactonase/LRE family protein [Acidimicrobiales bacterium]